MILPQYLKALEMEQRLGDPERADNLLSFARALQLDEEDAFPEAQVSALNAMGMPSCYVPRALGGEFTDCEGFVALGRVLARRNMSVAVAYSTMLWSTLSWLGGSDRQKRDVAGWIMHNASFPCLAYSESDHGADLVSNRLTATLNSDGSYTLRGEKWPINRAIRSDFLVLLARTDERNNLRNHSLFIIKKDQLDSRRYYYLPRVKTHGLKGCDISGIGFRDCVVPASCLVGDVGHGLELALKGFQITRTFCTSLSLGVGDTALRLVADYASRRTLYGTAISNLPHTRDVMANSYLSLLMAECVSIVSARGLHICPQVYSSWSSIAKVQVCHLIDYANAQLASVLGARFYMRDQQGVGVFQKFFRDGAVVSIFDGSSHVCLDSLASLLESLVRPGEQAEASRCMELLFDLRAPLPALDHGRVTLFSREGDPLIGQLPYLLQRLEALPTDQQTPPAMLQRLQVAGRTFLSQAMQLKEQITSKNGPRGARNSALRFALAERYCAVYSVAACLGVWLYSRDVLTEEHRSGHWLLAVLERGLQSHFHAGGLCAERVDQLYEAMTAQRCDNQMFSLLAWPLAAHGLAESVHESMDKEEMDNANSAA
ncbi:acyl-CoA dehydrogenase family protein [Pseudomonas sp. NPDC089743]|uniref:acyl-CoA dehydrogenase family protein n=1 Tax=Pseudomonas sp. NPDC089743 TaxID=3364471 RepID=UPI0037FDE6AB